MRDAIHHDIDIDAPADEVWRVFSDLARWPEWFPYAASARARDGGTPFAPGGHVDVELALPVLGRTRLELAVAEADPPRMVRWVGAMRGFRGDHRYTFDQRVSSPRPRTRVTSHETISGAVPLLLGRAMQSRLDDAAHLSLARLAALVTVATRAA